MKKLFILSWIIFGMPIMANADVVTEFTGMCSSDFPDYLNAVFELQSATCNIGYFLPAASTTCAACPAGYTCPGGTYSYNHTESQGLARTATLYTTTEANACASNYPKYMNAVFEIQSVTCESGYFLPAASTTCAACPAGYACVGGTYSYNHTKSQGLARTAALYTTTATNACASNYPKYMNAVFEYAYTCDAGYFLPANNTECVACPNGYTCPGGTFVFSVHYAQGITRTTNDSYTTTQPNLCASNFPKYLNAVFEFAGYDCAPGYYLPANANSCAQCLANNYCVGGTYTFDATNAQGITQCDTGYSSAANASYCTPNIITINWAGADGVHATNTCTYGGALTTPATEPTKRGHTFLGWKFIQP